MSLHKNAGVYETALRRLLPSRQHGLLLKACLCEREVAASAWLEFAAEAQDLKAYFEADQMGLKGMLPFIEASLRDKGIDAGKTFHTYARVALVREELRGKIYGEILDSVLAAFDAAAIPVVLLKGAVHSATNYPQPSTRHNHAIDLLVNTTQMTAAQAILSSIKFSIKPLGFGAAFHRNFRHSTGLALGLHSKLLFLPHFDMPLDRIRDRTRSIQIGGRSVSVMSPEDSLVHICGHATYSRSRANLRWACDAFYLLQRPPELDWHAVTDTAVRSRLALPVLVLLRWLKETLMVSIPAERLDALHQRSKVIDDLTAEGIYASLLHAMLSRGRALRGFGASRWVQLGFLKFSAFPSPTYVRWRHNIDRDWLLPLYYADRPRRFALHAMSCAARKVRGKGMSDGPDISAMEDIA